MAAGPVEPALDAVLRLRDGGAHGLFGGGTIGVSGRSGDVAFSLETLAELVVGLADVLAQNVTAGGFVLAEVAGGAIDGVRLKFCTDRRRPRI